MSEKQMLVCSVGGSSEPLVASVQHWQPGRVAFVATAETKERIEDEIIPQLREAGIHLAPGLYDCYLLPDGQDLSGCLGKLRAIDRDVQRWLERGDQFQIVVDFTGGTKCMSAALTLHAHRWPCVFSYVGGHQRTKDGVGIVVSGSERVLHTHNPWNALGYQTVDQYVVLFNQGNFAAAQQVADAALQRIDDPSIRQEMATLKQLAEAYLAWERFQHKQAWQLFEKKLLRALNHLRHLFSQSVSEDLEAAIRQHVEHLTPLCDQDTQSIRMVYDLLANAKRRADEQRLDDAVARLYRATEATAQVELRGTHRIFNTGRVPATDLPQTLQREWNGRCRNGELAIGLQDAYRLLAEFDNPLGKRFQELKWNDPKHSPLVARNQSVLAHGFSPISEKTFRSLWKGCLTLADIGEDNLPSFPTLAVT